MRRWTGVLLAAVALLLAAGILLTLLVRNRVDASKEYTLNNLRELNHYAIGSTLPDKTNPQKPVERSAVPPGTVVRPEFPADERLSWVVDALPYFNQRRQAVEALSARIDRSKPWKFEANFNAAGTVLVALVPAAVEFHRPAGPAPTYYLGVSGRGPNAATRNLGPPVPTRAGAFRYNGDTPFDAFKDGLSNTLLLGETATDLGPWLRGGPSTLRGIDDSPDAKPVLGPHGQFGGVHTGLTAFSLADGSAKFFGEKTDVRVLAALATIAGGTDDPNLVD